MESCANCGATLSEDAEWCGQCFAPVRRAAGGRIIGAPAAAAIAAADAAQGSSGGAAWMRTMNAAPSKPDTTPEYSRWKAGPTSMGAVGRSIVSVLIVLGLLIGYPALRGMMVAFVGFDVPGLGFMGMYAALAIPVGAILLVRVWKAQRIG
jgi:Na+-transporting NADH:ubiquinone oxidoreductase subunit NqrB